MQFTLLSNAGVPNATAEIANANNYPNIRVFTVGDGTSSTVPLKELNTTSQVWSVASNTSIGGPGWDYMSVRTIFMRFPLWDTAALRPKTKPTPCFPLTIKGPRPLLTHRRQFAGLRTATSMMHWAAAYRRASYLTTGEGLRFSIGRARTP